MYLMYVDDSGDPGLPSAGSPTPGFTLSLLAIEDDRWISMLDQLVAFRRFLNTAFNLRMRDELKASGLVNGSGAFSGMSWRARQRIYRMAMNLQRATGLTTAWAVTVDKQAFETNHPGCVAADIRDIAWRYMMQRVERFTSKSKINGMVFPDEGYNQYVRTLFRKIRRYQQVPSAFGNGSLSVPATRLIEDPSFRQSHESYFVQFADLNSYAASHFVFPAPWFGGAYWDRLGNTRNTAVNQIRGGPPAIVLVQK